MKSMQSVWQRGDMQNTQYLDPIYHFRSIRPQQSRSCLAQVCRLMGLLATLWIVTTQAHSSCRAALWEDALRHRRGGQG